MSDPHRLVRTRLDQVSRRALDAAIADEPPVDAKAGVWRAIGLALPASGVVLGAAVSSSAATTTESLTAANVAVSGGATALGKAGAIAGAASGVATGASWVTKAVVAGVGIGLAVNVAMLAPRVLSRSAHEAAATNATASVSPRPLRPLPGLTPIASALTQASASGASSAAPAFSTRLPDASRSNELAVGSVAASKGAAPASAADTLREESQLLMRVRQALSASEGLRALELVAEHRRAFGAGTLTQERDVMEVQALVQLGRVKDAKAHAKAFLQRYPGSPHTEKVRAIVER